MGSLPQVKNVNCWNKTSISRLPARSQNIGLKTKNLSSFSNIRRGRKLLSLDEVSTWAEPHALLQMALDRQDYSEANSISAALSLKVDAHLTNDMISSEGAAFQKTFLVAKITESLNTAIKTEGYACDVLGVLQVISSRLQSPLKDYITLLKHCCQKTDMHRLRISVPKMHSASRATYLITLHISRTAIIVKMELLRTLF